MPYGKTPMKKKGSMMYMAGKHSTHVDAAKDYPNDGHLHYKDGKKIPTPAKMNYDSAMKMGHDSAAKMYGSKSAMKMGHDSAMKMGHDSAMKMGHEGSAMKNVNQGYAPQVKSPMKMQGSWMSKHSSSALHMGHSPMKKGHESAKQEKKNLLQDMPIDDKASAMKMGHSPMKMGHSPMKKYDRVVLGGNKGDKSKTKPGKKDFM